MAYHWPVPRLFKKWMGYIDQYIIFPREVRSKIKKLPDDFLFVLTDHALGPWVPLVTTRPHVIHCHDFLAQRSSLGEISENPTTWTGRRYQAFIRRGYSKGKNFISISKATQNDLHRLLKRKPLLSEIVYNGLLDEFAQVDDGIGLEELQKELSINLSDGYLLHVGGNQWYKNRTGIVEIYNVWRATSVRKLPLVLVGPLPSESLRMCYDQSPYKDTIHFLTGVSDVLVKKLYRCASLFLFPSLAEGFGWPIIEAMASGCPVVTTDAEPMTEVAGGAAFLISRQPEKGLQTDAWAIEVANVINHILRLSDTDRAYVIAAGHVNVQRFNSAVHLDRIETIYKTVLENKD